MRSIRHAAATSAALLAAILLPISAPQASAASSTSPGGIQLVPTDGVSYFHPTIAAAGVWAGNLVVENTSKAAIPVTVSGVEGLTSVDTGAVYATTAAPPEGAATWIVPRTPKLVIPAKGAVTVGFKVQVPRGTSAGDHLAGVSVQPTTASPPTGKGSMKIRLVIQNVVGVLVSVPGPATFGMSIGPPALGAATGFDTAQATIPLEDNEALLGKPSLRVTVSGAGSYHREVDRRLGTMLPADTIRYPLPWPTKLASGVYTVTACVSGGITRNACRTSTVRLGKAVAAAGAPGAVATTNTPRSSSHMLLWILAVVLTALVFAGGGLAIGRRRR